MDVLQLDFISRTTTPKSTDISSYTSNVWICNAVSNCVYLNLAIFINHAEGFITCTVLINEMFDAWRCHRVWTKITALLEECSFVNLALINS